MWYGERTENNITVLCYIYQYVWKHIVGHNPKHHAWFLALSLIFSFVPQSQSMKQNLFFSFPVKNWVAEVKYQDHGHPLCLDAEPGFTPGLCLIRARALGHCILRLQIWLVVMEDFCSDSKYTSYLPCFLTFCHWFYDWLN